MEPTPSVKFLIGKTMPPTSTKKTPSGPGSKRARAAVENSGAMEPKVELGEIEFAEEGNPALVVEHEEKAPSLKKANTKMSSTYHNTPVKCIKSVEYGTTSPLKTTSPGKCINSAEDDDTTSVLKIPSPVKSIQNVEDDMTSLPRTPSPEKSINSVEDEKNYKTPSPEPCMNITPSSHPVRIIPRKLVLLPSTRKPLPVIVKAIERRMKMIAGLPKLFDRIYFLFQSAELQELTKEEVLQKLDIVDTKEVEEVEEQLKLLVELAPEWIHEKHALSGESLLCVNKIESPEATRMRLCEAR
ncbi:CDT1-like protein a, chloroplastic [Salvia splendens]|uniref:CDT1-like protein a, chloroplastic n=1 Tax=Salvia splendens TaxID=180675 RepID=UPI001C27EF37|nr:CDT1-like protein a, chloroplastic [Salvia splendens]